MSEHIVVARKFCKFLSSAACPASSLQPFLVFGLLTTGLAIGARNSGAAAANAVELASGAAAAIGDLASAAGSLF
jgi:hypothetical protein